MDVGTRLDLTGERMLQIESIVREAVPELKSLLAEVGGGGWHGGGSHTISLRLGLVPLAERTRSSDEVAQDLRRRLSQIPGLTVRVRPGSGMVGRMMGAGTGDRLQVEIRGYDLEDAARLAKRVKEIVESTPGVADARISREKGTPEAVVVVDRVKAGDLGFSVSQVASALQTLIGGTMAGTYREEGREYDIVVRLADAEKRSLGELLDLEISSASGRSVPLRSLVTVRPGLGPVRIERRNQERTVTVSAELDSAGEKQRDLGSVAADIQRELDQIPLPPGFSFSITGDWEEQQKSFRELAISLVLALALVYMVMASQYESLRDPFVVMFSVPFAVIGVVVVLVTTGTTLNIQSFIGGIMLGGIVVNNAILLVDHINLLRRRDGMPLREAIEEAGRRRLRPILMTTSTTVLAMLPLALGIGEGAEAQAPMARVVVGGLISSMLVTLVLVPVVYSLFERMRPKDTVEASAHGNDVLNH
jgi:HAE1 family hydrophobic/amphiphilic exporter-1